MPTDPPTSRSEVLTPSPAIRGVLTLVALFVTAGLLWQVPAMVSGDFEWTTTTMIAIPILVVMVIGGVTGAVAAWTGRVWVDYDRMEIHQFVVLRDVVVPLDAPTTAQLDYRRQAVGSTVSGTWKVVVRRPGSPTLTVNTPFVPDIADVVRILAPALAHNPDLPADDYTRRALLEPAAPLVPPQVAGD